MMSKEKSPNIPEWDIEETNPELVDPLEEAFSTIMDPELGMNIIQLGLVRNVVVKNEQATVTMILTTPFCPYGPSIMESARMKAEKTLNIPTKIIYGRETWDPTMMEEGHVDDWGLY
jgi:metal-sulfur cluster biosynthetic enzyme